ncbi:MAG TPA: hypothetical protein PKK37_02075, partial [Candidatus Pacearchaeota archaeon]|nr:hypothetical protein [Candidatus Pacearchaeota archaeon]
MLLVSPKQKITQFLGDLVVCDPARRCARQAKTIILPRKSQNNNIDNNNNITMREKLFFEFRGDDNGVGD